MLDILKLAEIEIEKHPVSLNQYPGSGHITNGFHRNVLSPRKIFCSLKFDYT